MCRGPARASSSRSATEMCSPWSSQSNTSLASRLRGQPAGEHEAGAVQRAAAGPGRRRHPAGRAVHGAGERPGSAVHAGRFRRADLRRQGACPEPPRDLRDGADPTRGWQPGPAGGSRPGAAGGCQPGAQGRAPAPPGRSAALLLAVDEGKLVRGQAGGPLIPALCVAKLDGRYLAVVDACSHGRARLSEGTLADVTVTCPRHGASFDMRTGQPITAGWMPVACYDIAVSGNRITVRRHGRAVRFLGRAWQLCRRGRS
jgi:3-phenylpropionate/trans-cinnamate dioxygenase ferredoxin component